MSPSNKFQRLILIAILVLSPLSFPAIKSHADPKPATAPDQSEITPEDQATYTTLDRKLPNVYFKKTPFNDALEFLRDVTGLSIWVNNKAIAAAGISLKTSITLDGKNVVVSKVLYDTLDQAGPKKLDYIVDGGVVIISTADDLSQHSLNCDLRRIRGETVSLDRMTPPDQKVQKNLDRVLPNVQFNNTPLQDAIEFLKDVTGANIVVNWQALEAAHIAKTAPVTFSVRNVKFAKVLDLILLDAAQAKLAYAIDDGVIMISTVDDLNKRIPLPAAKP